VVLGGGPAGEHFVGALRRLDSDAELTLVESHLVGGECSYYACMPTKTMLRAAELSSSLDRAPGLAPARPDPAGVWEWRDWMTSNWDDAGQLPWLEEQNCRLVRGEARITRPGVVTVGEEELEYDRLVVATGSTPIIPDAVAGVDYWTNRDATMTHDVPETLAVMGSGPVGAELAQFFARLGSRVTVIERGERLLGRVHEDAAKVLTDVFREEGIDVRVGVSVDRAEPGITLRLSDGTTVDCERLLVATGRRARLPEGLDAVGVAVGPRGIEVDERCRAADGVWAIGDVNGVAQFTHVGKYQARVVADDMCGRKTRADYRAIPAGIFTDPEIGTVGRTEGVSARWELSATPRTSTYEKPSREGFVRVFADPDERVLVGAVAVGPQATEWLGQLTLAVRTATPIDVLLDTIQPYPTFSEAIFFAWQDLRDTLSA
jgi:pyruvate/2-oxoglutarate dehydrogenase complex dihydrolipoamide dehydrogenase (E3) component